MQKNIGKKDRIIRLFLAGGFFVVSFVLDNLLFLVFSFLLAYTSFKGFCMFYPLFGINTCEKDQCKISNKQEKQSNTQKQEKPKRKTKTKQKNKNKKSKQ